MPRPSESSWERRFKKEVDRRKNVEEKLRKLPSFEAIAETRGEELEALFERLEKNEERRVDLVHEKTSVEKANQELHATLNDLRQELESLHLFERGLRDSRFHLEVRLSNSEARAVNAEQQLSQERRRADEMTRAYEAAKLRQRSRADEQRAEALRQMRNRIFRALLGRDTPTKGRTATREGVSILLRIAVNNAVKRKKIDDLIEAIFGFVVEAPVETPLIDEKTMALARGDVEQREASCAP